MFFKPKFYQIEYVWMQHMVIVELDRLYKYICWIDKKNNKKNYDSYIKRVLKIEGKIELLEEIYEEEIDEWNSCYSRKNKEQIEMIHEKRKVIQKFLQRVKTYLEKNQGSYSFDRISNKDTPPH